MFVHFKNIKKFLLLFLFFILIGCQFQEPLKTHGIMYIENRSEKLTIDKSNKNDVIRIMGQPQIKDDQSSGETWIYIERVLTKGKFLRLGQHIVKTNNILVLNFSKYGILEEKNLLNKEDRNDIQFSMKNTENNISQKSFVQKFLQSIKTKMYSNRK
tara:strand:+ start:58 stop:528 length:471 start_codon:yes stop_codon:yes gene_type:complete